MYLIDRILQPFVRSCLDLGVDPPSSGDPPFHASVTASNSLTNSTTAESIPSISRGGCLQWCLWFVNIITQIQASKDSEEDNHPVELREVG